MQTSPGVFTYDYWPAAQRLLAENFREKLTSFDYNHIEEEIIESMRRYLALPELEPSRIRTTNVAAMGLCAWIRALEAYHRVCISPSFFFWALSACRCFLFLSAPQSTCCPGAFF